MKKQHTTRKQKLKKLKSYKKIHHIIINLKKKGYKILCCVLRATFFVSFRLYTDDVF